MFLTYYLQKDIEIEYCYYLIVNDNISDTELNLIKSMLTLDHKYQLYSSSKITGREVGPRTNFTTQWCQTMLEVFKSSGIKNVELIEHSIKYQNYENVPNYDLMLYQTYYETFFQSRNEKVIVNDNIEEVDIEIYNREKKLGFDSTDIKTYQQLFLKLDRKPTNVELYDLSQCNSEHARHWFFKGKLTYTRSNYPRFIYSKYNNHRFNYLDASLFQKIKMCYDARIHKLSLVSFYDNASVIEGAYCNYYKLHSTLKYEDSIKKIHYSYKAETHNFPTGISPFPGAATGSGGRIRDILCVGKGGDIIASTAGYCVGDIFNNTKLEYDFLYNSPRNILIEASNGASDYGNKIGEPLIQGFVRSFRGDYLTHNGINKRVEWLKPIMFSGGIGKVLDYNVKKDTPKVNNIIVRIGGPAYRIGMGGGSASSRTQENSNSSDDFNAVQRGDPLMANKLVKFIRSVNNSNRENIILSIHDQGSGGMANVTREICEDKGAEVYLSDIYVGDKTLTSLEKWVAEYQEQVTFLTEDKHLDFLEGIARRENISLNVVGRLNESENLTVYNDRMEKRKVVCLPMLEDNVRKTFPISKPREELQRDTKNLQRKEGVSLVSIISEIFKLVDVGSKQFLTNKVDRSVSGLVVQQQCIGPYHLPLSNLAAVKNSHQTQTILVSAIGEQPIKGIHSNISNMVALTVGEMLTNIIWCQIGSLRNINSVANWMWASTSEEDGWLLNEAVDTLVYYSKKLGFSINGGKDSLSMKVKQDNTEIKCPHTLTLSGYTTTHNHRKIITPNLKSSYSTILLVRLEVFGGCLGGSAYSRIFLGNKEMPNFESLDRFRKIFMIIQDLIKNNIIYSGHDISDGGLITTLCEMAFSSFYGLDLDIKSYFKLEEYLFSEELGLVLEIGNKNLQYVIDLFKQSEIEIEVLGHTKLEKEVTIKYNRTLVLDEKNDDLRFMWQNTSYMLEKEQANPECIEEEVLNCLVLDKLNYQVPKEIQKTLQYNNFIVSKYLINKHRVAIIRGEGSNGELEMAHCFQEVGFDCFDVTLTDIVTGKISLRKFRGIAFVGGFTYSDVLGSAYGWYYSIVNNKILKQELDNFYQREDTFSLGICNGCQLMSLLGWIPSGITLEKNISNRFESRWSKVKIIKNNSIFLKGLEEMVFGIYSSHGEGRIVDSKNNNEEIFPIRYVDESNNSTEKYPFNPNGSIGGKAAIISPNGRHLAVMPHPERTILGWQLPLEYEYKYTPWFMMFRNVHQWCEKNVSY